MTSREPHRPGWTRRDAVSGGFATAGAVILGGRARSDTQRGSSATGSLANLDDLGQRIRGRFLSRGSRGYDDARKVWNLAYDRHPLAMARCAGKYATMSPPVWALPK